MTWAELIAALAAELDGVEAAMAADDWPQAPPSPWQPPEPSGDPSADERAALAALLERNRALQARLEHARREVAGQLAAGRGMRAAAGSYASGGLLPGSRP